MGQGPTHAARVHGFRVVFIRDNIFGLCVYDRHVGRGRREVQESRMGSPMGSSRAFFFCF